MKRFMIKLGNKLLQLCSDDAKCKKKQQAYNSLMLEYSKKETEELDFLYVSTKANYEAKKNFLSYFSVSVLITGFIGIWGFLFEVIGKMIQFYQTFSASERVLMQCYLYLVIFLTLLVAVVITVIISINVKELKKLQQRLLMIEIARKRKDCSCS